MNHDNRTPDDEPPDWTIYLAAMLVFPLLYLFFVLILSL